MKHPIPKAFYALSLLTMLISVYAGGFGAVLGLAIVWTPFYAFLAFTTRYTSKNRSKRILVRIGRVVSIIVVLLAIISFPTLLQDCSLYASVCKNTNQAQLLSIISFIGLAGALITSLKPVQRYFNEEEIDTKNLTNPIFERYESMGASIYKQYVSDQGDQLIRSIAVAKTSTLVADKRNSHDSVVRAREAINHTVYNALVDGYTLWLVEHLQREGSLKHCNAPDYILYAEEWNKVKPKKLEAQPDALQDVVAIVHADNFRKNHLFDRRRIPRFFIPVMRRLDLGWMNTGINIAEFENTYRSEDAEEKVEAMTADRKDKILALLDELNEAQLPMYLAGDLALDLLINNKISLGYYPIFIADAQDAVKLRTMLQKLDYIVEAQKDFRMTFRKDRPGSLQYAVEFYTKAEDPERYYWGESSQSNLEFRGAFEFQIEHEGRMYNVASPAFFIQHINNRLQEDVNNGAQQVNFYQKTNLDSLMQLYFPGASSDEERFQPIRPGQEEDSKTSE